MTTFKHKGYADVFGPGAPKPARPAMLDDEAAEIIHEELHTEPDADHGADHDAVRAAPEVRIQTAPEAAPEPETSPDGPEEPESPGADSSAADRAKTRLHERPTPKADMRKVSLVLPNYAYEALFQRAMKNRTTLQFEIFKALRGNGINIRDADMIPDGRRHNAKRRK